MRKTVIVIPCYNEALRLAPQAFITALDQDEQLSFLFVNDGSTDNTLAVLEALQAARPAQVELVNLPHNSGKAEAVRVGMLQAIAGNVTLIGYWDADLSTPLAAIGQLREQLESAAADLVIGSRVRLLGRNIQRRAVRHYPGRIFATMTSLLLQIAIYDTQCGAKLFRTTPVLAQVLSRPFTVSWIFDVELLARFAVVMDVPPQQASCRWVEYPLAEWTEMAGSKLVPFDFVHALFEFFRLFIHLRTPARRLYRKQLVGS